MSKKKQEPTVPEQETQPVAETSVPEQPVVDEAPAPAADAASPEAGDQPVAPAKEKEKEEKTPDPEPEKPAAPEPTPGDCRTCTNFPGAVTDGAAEFWLKRTATFTRRPCGTGPCANKAFGARI